MSYNTAKLSDINTERTIPANTKVRVVLAEPAKVANTKQDGTGSPKIELVYKVQGGPYANFNVREQLWISTTPKEGKEKPPFVTQALPTIAKLYKAIVPVPKPTFGNAGEETSESKAARAPHLAKMDQFIAGINGPDQLAQRISTVQNKPFDIIVGVETYKDKPKNVVSEYVAA